MTFFNLQLKSDYLCQIQTTFREHPELQGLVNKRLPFYSPKPWIIILTLDHACSFYSNSILAYFFKQLHDILH